MASAGIPNACAFSNSPLILDAPSSSENSVCVCRWTKLFAAIGSREAPPIGCHAGLGVEVIPADPCGQRGDKLHACDSARSKATLGPGPWSRRRARKPPDETLLLFDRHLRDLPGAIQVPVRGQAAPPGDTRTLLRRRPAPGALPLPQPPRAGGHVA